MTKNYSRKMLMHISPDKLHKRVYQDQINTVRLWTYDSNYLLGI